jgi:hypothetical protein
VRRLLPSLLVAAALCGVAATGAGASTWCGTSTVTDLVPQTVAGPSVHFVYAYPSDGTDRLGEFGTTMQTDAETIDAWWRGQDPARTPRFDLFGFSCGTQLDISDVRLSNTAGDLQLVGGRFDKIVASLQAAGLVSTSQIYVVYYDGPSDDTGVCGQGGTTNPDQGHAFAVVFSGGCPSEPTSVTAAHELTHALGAVASPAPHQCPPPDEGHVCDPKTDLMYPFVDGTPLSGLVLDAGRDDYYGAPGVGFDVRTSRWLRHLDEPTAQLALALKGAGTVAGDAPGFRCSLSCASTWDGGETVTLTATPAAGMRFVRWGGACTGDLFECRLTLAGSTSVSALFAPTTYPLLLNVAGRGRVIASALGASCPSRCRLKATSYRPFVVRAVARKGWRFKRWTGSCRGSRPTCTLPMTSASTARAVFGKSS